MNIELILEDKIRKAVSNLFGAEIQGDLIQIQNTRKEFKGDFTIVVFPLLKFSKKGPGETSNILGEYLMSDFKEIDGFNVVKGFLNLELKNEFWLSLSEEIFVQPDYGITPQGEYKDLYMVEYSSPNTNKPLHLGHIRNNLIGFSVSKILEANGYQVIKTNIVNDRGIHICKSMLAWEKWGHNETPETSGKKGDHLVGEYYVKFEQELRKQSEVNIQKGMTGEEAQKNTDLLREAQEMLQKWEMGDTSVLKLWKKMNGWVYEGFDQTYKRLGVEFDETDYESETYKDGKKVVEEALNKGILEQKKDSSVWADLTEDGLDEKLLLRADGTAVYMTQDLGTAVLRYEKHKFKEHIYVVGNEQNYHFQVLKLVLKKMGYPWADNLFHLSYGMVELPEGKMKSREGKVVDADDLIDEMLITAGEMSEELGKLNDFSEKDREDIFRKVGLGALKYFILKVDPKKNMTFDPKESVDFNGNTGPFIQYTYARIKSVLRKAGDLKIRWQNDRLLNFPLLEKEKELIKLIRLFSSVVKEAGSNYSPALVANYCYDLAKEYNQFYHDHIILREEDTGVRNFRLRLSEMTGRVIESGMGLLGIEVPERM